MASIEVMLTMVLLAQAGSGERPTFLENLKTVADIIGTTVTAAALILGGIWAYFKYVKGRTYRPRISVALSGQWRLVNGRHLLHARVTVGNVGASNITLLQRGTGLRVSVLASVQPVAPASAAWENIRVFEIFTDHDWIESGETVSDDLLIDLGVLEPTPTLFESRLVWKWSKRKRNIAVLTSQVIPVDSTIEEHGDRAAAVGGKERRTTDGIGTG
jgi:hypothetical protein